MRQTCVISKGNKKRKKQITVIPFSNCSARSGDGDSLEQRNIYQPSVSYSFIQCSLDLNFIPFSR